MPGVSTPRKALSVAENAPRLTAASSSSLISASLLYVASVVVAACLLTLHLWGPSASAGAVSSHQPSASSLSSNSALHHPLLAAHELLQVDNGSAAVELVWQEPRTPAHGVLLLFHGCSHSATDFWPASDSCAQCLGLPEETRITRAVLNAGLLPLAASSADRTGSRCWVPDKDGPRVQQAVDALLTRLRLTTLPVFVLGASSGGAMAATFPAFSSRSPAALSVQIMAVPPGLLRRVADKTGGYPPSLWAHMPRDERMAEGVAASLKSLRDAGRVAQELRIQPLPLLDGTLAARLGPNVSAEASAAVAAALRGAGLVDGEGMLSEDPRRGRWREAMREAGLLAGDGSWGGDSLEADASALAEELNVLWAAHEISGDVIGETLAFFDQVLVPSKATGG